MTFLTRGSGFVSRKLARVISSGKPLPPDLDPHLASMVDYSDHLMLQSWSMERAKPTRAQLKARCMPQTLIPIQTLTQQPWSRPELQPDPDPR